MCVICSKCGNQSETKQRYCRACKATYMRERREPYSEMSEEAKSKSRTRAYTNVLKARGKIIPQPCKCGSIDVEAHHTDYQDPRTVIWLCRSCHMLEHM